MWLAIPLISVALAILLHGLICNRTATVPRLPSFLFVGLILGAIAAALLIARYGLAIETIAGLAIYAAASELYIFLFGSTETSVSARALVQLYRQGKLREDDFCGPEAGTAMRDRRLQELVGGGFLEQSNGRYQVTKRGLGAAHAFRRLRHFFRRPHPLPDLLDESSTEMPPSRAGDVAAIIVLLAIPVVLFWPFLNGSATFVGDSDRMNHMMSVLKIMTEGYRQGIVPTWNPFQFGGYSLLTLPYNYPHPVGLIPLLWPPAELYHGEAYAACLLVMLAGLTSFLFLRRLTGATFPALIGSGLYQLTALPLLKISQNDMSYLVLILAPLFLLAVASIRPGRTARGFAGIALLTALLLTFGFLQKAAYLLILVSAYALWQAVRERAFAPLLTTAAGILTGLVVSLPRIVAVGQDVFRSVRYHGPSDQPPTFNQIYESQTISLVELLRWLDERIFGATVAQASAWKNSINLSEGVLLYASCFIVPLLLFGLVRLAWTRQPWVAFRTANTWSDGAFFALVLAAGLLVALTKAGFFVIYQFFLGMDFLHARILVIAVIAQAALVALCVRTLHAEPDGRFGGLSTRALVAGLIVAAVAVAGIEIIAAKFAGQTLTFDWSRLPLVKALSVEALVRIALSALLVVGALLAWEIWRPLPGRRSIIVAGIGFALLGQAFAFGQSFIAGDSVRQEGMPFRQGGRLVAAPDAFRAPSEQAREAFARLLRPEEFRTAVVCEGMRIFCSPHIANFWHLRGIEGYISSIPDRLAVLPWPDAVMGQRSISFNNRDLLNWPLLALLNVRYAIVATEAVMTNRVQTASGTREAGPDDTTILENPLAVAPRLFFARQVRSVADRASAVKALFPDGSATVRPDVERESVVEGFRRDLEMATGDDARIDARFRYGRVEIMFAPDAKPRFLVLNERYDPYWQAHAGTTPLRVYATNVVMSGIEVPAHVGRVTLRYRPPPISLFGYLSYALGAGLFLVLLLAHVGHDARHPKQPSV
jgi:hypothetical protein